MSTIQIAARLFELQQLDLEMDHLTAELRSVDNALQDSPTIRGLRSEYKLAEQQLQSSQQAQREAEWTLEETNHRLTSQEERLSQATASNAKELQTVQQEIQQLQAQQSRQEEAVREIADLVESLQEVLRNRQEALKQAEEAREAECASLRQRYSRLQEQQQALERQRQQLISELEPGLVERYQKMRRTKQGHAVSRVENDSCQWCRALLAPSELQLVQMSAELQSCTNCGRILYYDR
ncbi:hypothetical protein EI42_06080 [Thermosporothrix hazakensis]|jgi:predicted  nucleic acid-binding Zn-ribbon protein|uniref:CT398-like coiled coil hairpin domain-containing protein n=2 Tax=Thermosporothrix TaxID=768650 RepID=A0A326TVF2_THEHA|nr:hypothetical protein [Thermosporothrix hazakensis]PZW19384.1 hypothetical protein EI42_06080 [Thermosporothrix hazakensis]BBH89854.1 hypothetical protein KTC_46050 [Thermosporothrix sp. COM3]GCE48050.1 hypothetical protein KTH_29190 [Thermosporothrix hazakensis]